MRPCRLLAALCFSIVAITFLLFLLPSEHDKIHSAGPESRKRKSLISNFFSFHTPLFPPSAIISLTDDNSTFFLARPAAFGPLLPTNGLSGQIWTGSGFGDDNLGRGGRAEGELGCSDVPGWDESLGKPGYHQDVESKIKSVVPEPKKDLVKEKDKSRRSGDDDSDSDTNSDMLSESEALNDGTDDHLHHPLPDSALPKPTPKSGTKHADIQSIQESAEIAGKVVLLSRGGCGFLEKVKWVQRRGGVALIVGDDVRGGPLVTMYASGDTSNITVSALFTSYTTAHLLSSLIPSGGVLGTPSKKGKSGKNDNIKGTKIDPDNKPNFTPTPAGSKPTAKVQIAGGAENSVEDAQPAQAQKGWFSSLFSWTGLTGDSSSSGVSRRPPSSGRIDWVQVDDWEQADVSSSTAKSGNSRLEDSKSGSTNPTADDFVIGVHDWRDPDLLPTKKRQDAAKVKPRKAGEVKLKKVVKETKLKGGSITPGSGEYEKPDSTHPDTIKHKPSSHDSSVKDEKSDGSDDGWLGKLQWTGSHESQCAGKKCTAASLTTQETSNHPSKAQNEAESPHREGLWVTLTPTNMSSSPFLDTLLVLVVSPLVTLTIVYALLLLRSRIRRRRWRAPKSVVDRLPVRTYHTISSEASTTSIATPASSSPTTPLLQPSSRRVISRSHSRSRPRSRTTSEVPDGGTSSSPLAEHDEALSAAEKRENGLAEWRRRYGGRQKECVVCLEEYVDGVSRVMSLPCGHEFHVDCITPWLTTRRRTCPICKGDVVRSMQRGSLSRQNSFDENHQSSEDEEDIQVQAAENRNDSPTAAMPVPSVAEDLDLERGAQRSRSPSPRPPTQSWRSWLGDTFFGNGYVPDRNR
ncbi:hypothetical protein EJ08DRAFT_721686 [Tothia fuscella]|uniref:RING-type E3 ubiquitin transferase n=1 Tax=Tothia fuscella TaxID=1048955 RepID=A0A9P4NLH1_9PEZI|nr:hypothetical protein EJ08DRAFT_721686 [Tothia fuscella]